MHLDVAQAADSHQSHQEDQKYNFQRFDLDMFNVAIYGRHYLLDVEWIFQFLYFESTHGGLLFILIVLIAVNGTPLLHNSFHFVMNEPIRLYFASIVLKNSFLKILFVSLNEFRDHAHQRLFLGVSQSTTFAVL